jgi:hypothetical protein
MDANIDNDAYWDAMKVQRVSTRRKYSQLASLKAIANIPRPDRHINPVTGDGNN